MKKILIICFMLATCTYIGDAQKQLHNNKKIEKKDKLDQAWEALQRSKDTTAMIIMDIKKKANEKIIYRTKLVVRIDTVWRIDTCITVMRKVDSQRIALMFRMPDTIKETKSTKKIFFFFRRHKKE